MNTHTLFAVTRLTDQELLARVHALAAEERQVTAVLIAHLAELDARGLYLAESYSSLFTYCTEALHLSEHAAYHRIEAARLARRFPAVLDMLAEGSLTLTTATLLAPHLTAANHQDVLARARHKSKRAVEELVAELRPQPPVPTVIRRLPAPATRGVSPEAPGTDGSVLAGGKSAGTADQQTRDPSRAAPRGRAAIVPLAPQRYKVVFTASARTCEKLRQAQALLRHRVPDGDLDVILDQALTALLEKLAREKLAATTKPRGSRPARPDSRHVPAAVKRAVWLRDGGRCAFVGPNGRRCTETAFLEFHHVDAYADGGVATVDNIELRCRAHNCYESELRFGSRAGTDEAGGIRAARGIREERAAYSLANSVRTELSSAMKVTDIVGRRPRSAEAIGAVGGPG